MIHPNVFVFCFISIDNNNNIPLENTVSSSVSQLPWIPIMIVLPVGTESSHMHESWDENYHRGYEWWIMKEAKKVFIITHKTRNSSMKCINQLFWDKYLYGL